MAAMRVKARGDWCFKIPDGDKPIIVYIDPQLKVSQVVTKAAHKEIIRQAFDNDVKSVLMSAVETRGQYKLEAKMKASTVIENLDLSDYRFVESFLVQALGTTRRLECDRCKDNPGASVWVRCRTTPALFDSCCGNCKRLDKATSCRHSAVFKENRKEAKKIRRHAQDSEAHPTKTARGRTTKKPASYKV